MKIFLVDISLFAHARVTNLISDLSDISIVGSTNEILIAEESIYRLRPDAMIFDIELQGRDGIEFIKRIKARLPSLIAIILTNASHPMYKERCMNAGANYFFDKSTEFLKVRDVLKELTHTDPALPNTNHTND
jgi:DNA-binding NarL/FixJ family response regulator